MQLETVGGTLQGMAEPLHVPNFVAALRELPLYREMSGMTAWRWNRGDLPEFAKYLPKAVAKTDNLPAVANLVADFVKAGWPKEQAT